MKTLKYLSLLSFLLPQWCFAQSGPVDNFDREAVTQFYRQYFCPADRIDTGWEGNLQKKKPGKISNEYTQALLDRIYFIRGLAGLSNNLTLDEDLTSRAQRLTHIIAANGLYRAKFRTPDELINDEDLDPYKTYVHYYPESIRDMKLAYTTVSERLATGLVNLIQNKDKRHEAHVPIKENHSPVELRRILNPSLSSLGIGETHVTVPHSGTYENSSLYMRDMTSAAILYGDDTPDSSTFKPINWPPAGYVPYMMANELWSSYIPGADMRTAYVTVKRLNNPGTSNPLPIIRVEIEKEDPIDTISWRMRDFNEIIRLSNFREGQDTVFSYEVTIGNIYFNGSFKDITYEVHLFKPHLSLNDMYFKLHFAPKVDNSGSDFIQFKLFTGDDCLLQSDGVIAKDTNGLVWLRYSTSPEGPFTGAGPGSVNGDADVENRYSGLKDGFYRFELISQGQGTGGGLGGGVKTYASSEVFQYSSNFGPRKLDETFQETIIPVKLYENFEAIKDQKTPDRGDSDGSGSSIGGGNGDGTINIDKLRKRFKRLRKKKRRCRKKKRANLCEVSTCKSKCRKIRKRFKRVKQAIQPYL